MRKLKNKKGFTFVEMLVCVLTLLMVGAICATGTGISVKSYQQSRFESDSQMLASTLDMGIGDVLRYASDIETDGNGNVTALTNHYYQMEDGYISLNSEGYFRVCKSPYMPDKTFALIGEKAYAGDLYISEFELKYINEVFKGKYTIKSNAMQESKTCEFTFRPIAE